MRRILIYTNIKPSKNLSLCPSGLLEWITIFLKKRNLSFSIINDKNKLNKAKNKIIIIYPASQIKEIDKIIIDLNKIITIGPDSFTFQAYTILKHKFFFFRYKLFKKIFFKCFTRILDKDNLNKKGISIVVGEKDYKVLNKIKPETYYLPHPYLSSLNIDKPLPTSLPINGLILIGKLKGVPVGFRDLEPIINKYLIPLLKIFKFKLFIFESTGLVLDKLIKNNQVEIIKTDQELKNNFFQSKIMINLSTCGGGTANRSLSSLYDGAFLFSTKFGARNIPQVNFKNQLFISKYDFDSEEFFNELRDYIKNLKLINNQNLIQSLNHKSEQTFEYLIKKHLK